MLPRRLIAIFSASFALVAAVPLRAQYPQTESIDIIVANADQVVVGRLLNSGSVTRNAEGERAGTIVLAVEQTLKGVQVLGKLDLPIKGQYGYYQLYSDTSDSLPYSHRLLVAVRRDGTGKLNHVTSIDLDARPLNVLTVDPHKLTSVLVLTKPDDVIRAAREEALRPSAEGKDTEGFDDIRAPGYDVEGSPFFGCNVVVPVDDRLEANAHAALRERGSDRYVAVWALERFKSDENIHLLTGLLNDPDPNVRRQAHNVLANWWKLEVPKPAP